MGFNCKKEHVLNLLNTDLYFLFEAEESFVVCETEAEGKARLICNSSFPCFVFRDLDKNKYGVFKKNKCADVLIVQDKKELYTSTIIEFKKTVTSANWIDIQQQIEGALYQMEVITGMLGIDSIMDSVVIVYLNDKVLTSATATPSKFHVEIERKRRGTMHSYSNDWKGTTLSFDHYPRINLVKKQAADTGGCFSADYVLT